MKKKTIYVSTNGHEFDSEEECQAYEELIAIDTAADEAFRAAGYSPKKVMEYTRVVVAWEKARQQAGGDISKLVLEPKKGVASE